MACLFLGGLVIIWHVSIWPTPHLSEQFYSKCCSFPRIQGLPRTAGAGKSLDHALVGDGPREMSSCWASTIGSCIWWQSIPGDNLSGEKEPRQAGVRLQPCDISHQGLLADVQVDPQSFLPNQIKWIASQRKQQSPQLWRSRLSRQSARQAPFYQQLLLHSWDRSG